MYLYMLQVCSIHCAYTCAYFQSFVIALDDLILRYLNKSIDVQLLLI